MNKQYDKAIRVPGAFWAQAIHPSIVKKKVFFLCVSIHFPSPRILGYYCLECFIQIFIIHSHITRRGYLNFFYFYILFRQKINLCVKKNEIFIVVYESCV